MIENLEELIQKLIQKKSRNKTKYLKCNKGVAIIEGKTKAKGYHEAKNYSLQQGSKEEYVQNNGKIFL